MDSNDWDRRYREARQGHEARLWSALPPRIVQETVAPWPVGRALDLATGDGRTAIWLALNGWSVTAVDFSAEAIALASQHATEAGATVDWQVADATAWTPAHQYDLITIMYLHLPRDQFATVLARVAGWIAPRGHLLVVGHDLANLETGSPGPSNPEVLYTPDRLRAAAGALRIERCETVRRDLTVDPESPDATRGFALDTVLVATARPSAPDSRPRPAGG